MICTSITFVTGGMELCNAYTELNDPVLQREAFAKQVRNSWQIVLSVFSDFFGTIFFVRHCSSPVSSGAIPCESPNEELLVIHQQCR